MRRLARYSLNSRSVLLGASMMLIATAGVGSQARPGIPTAQVLGITAQRGTAPADSVKRRPRPRAIEYSDWYSRRLTVHRIGSYAMLPLFGAEYYLGEKLIDGSASESERSIHVGVATAIGGLFAVNTVTGIWNLWDSRKDPAGRTKRLIHVGLMLAADAGFALAAASADDDGGEFSGSDNLQARATKTGRADDGGTHKQIALASIGISTVGTALMWFWK